MTIHWKAVEQHFSVVLFVFQFCPVCNFGKFINFGLATVRSEKVKLAYLLLLNINFTCLYCNNNSSLGA